jgi:diguanylate cyclase (GGDEF)-like protein
MQAEIERLGGPDASLTLPTTPPTPAASYRYLAVGLACTLAYFFLDAPFQNLAQDSIGLSAVGAILVGVRLHRPRKTMPWLLMALGQLLFVVGDLIWTYYEEVRHVESPFPSVADVSYLAAYVPLVLGLVLVVHARHPGRNRASLIDAAIVTVAASVVTWIYLIAPVTSGTEQGVSHAVSVAYPLADVMLIAFAARFIFGAEMRAFSFRFLSLSLIALITADGLYLFATLHDWYSTGSPLDAGWMLSYVLWGAAALHPSMRILTDPEPRQETPRLTQGRIVALGGAALIIPVMLAIQALRHAPLYIPIIVAGSTVASLLVVIRMGGLVGALQEAALHDHLTGLPNRRLLLDRLAQTSRRAERNGSEVAVLFIDLGGFKSVNDRFGHDAGDEALVEIGRRIASVTRKSDTVARLGGDEFVIVCEGLDDIQAQALAARIREHVAVPLDVKGTLIELIVDLGIAVARPQPGDEPTRLLEAADRAMYQSKGRGYSPEGPDTTR